MLRPSAFSVLFVLAAGVHAQIEHGGAPVSALEPLVGPLPVLVAPAPDLARLRAEDAERGDWPLRYGAIQELSVGADDGGRWDATATHAVWRVEVASPGASSIGVHFERFDLPPGGEVFLYDPARRRVVGALTEANEQPNGELAVQPIAGDRVVVEYQQPLAAPGAPDLRIGSLVHDYRGVFDTLAQAQLRAPCYVDVNCPAGAPYQDVKRSVVEVIAGGSLCSAGMLNNTEEDGTPYFLTANHCGNMTNVVAIFNYERTGCGSGNSSTSQTVSGATLLAATASFDSQLYRLNNTPPTHYRPYFAGWSRGSSFGAPAVGIHHAEGLPKKLSIDNQAPTVGTDFFNVRWETGTVGGGSSGSPLFNHAQRVIGPACCVNNFDCNIQTVSYGRLGKFWNQRNLSQWLDPNGKANGVWDGVYPYEASATPYNNGGANPVVLTADAPDLGSSWTMSADTSAFPAATSVSFLIHADDTQGVFVNAGELLVDLGSPKLFSTVESVSGGSASYTAPLPNDPVLKGQRAYVQAALLGGGVRLTNGVALRLW